MRKSARATALLAACMFVTGCGRAAYQTTSPDLAAVTTFDGVYGGTVRVSSTAENIDPGLCTTEPDVTIVIRNGAFSYAMPHPNVPGNPTPVYSATIENDGKFQGDSGIAGTMSGQVTGRRLAGTVDGSGCVYALTADRR